MQTATQNNSGPIVHRAAQVAGSRLIGVTTHGGMITGHVTDSMGRTPETTTQNVTTGADVHPFMLNLDQLDDDDAILL